jgi:hypothetical protein
MSITKAGHGSIPRYPAPDPSRAGIKEPSPFKFGPDKTLLLELHRAEIPLILGTDAGTGAMGIVPGFSIHDLTGKRIYGTGRTQNMLSHTVSESILKPGQTYKHRVRVVDSDDWVEMQNRSESLWLTFTMSQTLE